tara:strand:- start:196 stop:336 length:141 start_codon:yes stop_codon:yes gene_type:complete
VTSKLNEKAIEDNDISIKINPKDFKNYVNRGIAKSQKKILMVLLKV